MTHQIEVTKLVSGWYTAIDTNGHEWSLIRLKPGAWIARRNGSSATVEAKSLTALREELWASCMFAAPATEIAELRGEYVENGVEYARCPICRETCSTHDDAANPMTLCGDCGAKCCSKCCDETSATRCKTCQARKEQARALGEQHMQYVDATLDAARARVFAQIEALFEEEAAQHAEVRKTERLIAELQEVRRNSHDAVTIRTKMREISRLLDVSRVEVAELNRIRAEIVMLTPRGMKAQRSHLWPNAGQIEFIRI